MLFDRFGFELSFEKLASIFEMFDGFTKITFVTFKDK